MDPESEINYYYHYYYESIPTGKRPKWCDYISDLARSRLGVERADELSEIAVDREEFRVLLGLLPQHM